MHQETTMNTLSWEPVETGHIYCAPACGGGCTMAAFKRATTGADALAKHIGPGWTPRVWENLGWHYSAISPCGRWKVHPFIYKGKVEGYTAFLGEVGGGGIWTGQGGTPQEAIAKTRAKAEDFVRRHTTFLDDIASSLDTGRDA
jgi:hypothetical protein